MWHSCKLLGGVFFYIMINTIITVAAFVTVIGLLTIILAIAIYAGIKAIGEDIDKNEY